MKQIIYERILQMGFLLFLLFITQSCSKNDEPLDDDKIKVGVFGGSISSAPESEIAKRVWTANLNIEVITCGVAGAGFSSLTGNCVPTQIEQAEVFDVYILWASTNDVDKSTIGDLDVKDETTQAGGIMKSVEIIKQKNSKALILFFTSLPRFDAVLYTENIPLFVESQIYLCERERIPYLDQYHLFKIDRSNYMDFYLYDNIHLNETGYQHIATMQMEFIRDNINKSSFHDRVNINSKTSK